MTFLDTHVLVWLHRGDLGLLSTAARKQIESDDVASSPVCVLELGYLREIGRLHVSPSRIIQDLTRDIGLSVTDGSFSVIAEQALTEHWTRDPFDRLLVAHAKCELSWLVTKDEGIRRHYARAIW